MQALYGTGPVRRTAALLGAGWLALASAAVHAQGNLGFLKDSPLAYFNADDAKLMRAAAAEVLKSTADGTKKDWANPATGNGGSITLLQAFSAPDGRHCVQLRLDNHAKKMDGTSIMSVCLSPDGRWKPEAVKPPK